MTTVFPAHSRATITLTDVGVVLGDKTVLSGINLSVSPGSRIALVGENGRGKTTLLRVLAGDLAPEHLEQYPGTEALDYPSRKCTPMMGKQSATS